LKKPLKFSTQRAVKYGTKREEATNMAETIETPNEKTERLLKIRRPKTVKFFYRNAGKALTVLKEHISFAKNRPDPEVVTLALTIAEQMDKIEGGTFHADSVHEVVTAAEE